MHDREDDSDLEDEDDYEGEEQAVELESMGSEGWKALGYSFAASSGLTVSLSARVVWLELDRTDAQSVKHSLLACCSRSSLPSLSLTSLALLSRATTFGRESSPFSPSPPHLLI